MLNGSIKVVLYISNHDASQSGLYRRADTYCTVLYYFNAFTMQPYIMNGVLVILYLASHEWLSMLQDVSQRETVTTVNTHVEQNS